MKRVQAATYQFADMAAYAAWISHPDYQAMVADLRPFVTATQADLWGPPSPVGPQPLRPKV